MHVTIEKTDKKYKLQGLKAGFLMFVAVLVFFNGEAGSAWRIAGGLAFALGLGLYLVNQVNIWWNHG
jgi:hypothetical protein